MKRRLVLLVFFVLAAFTVSGCSPAEEELAAKPVIYLYPEVETAVTVTLDYDGQLTTTYPAYDGSWHVTALPDGTLYDAEGREYSYLFWEGVSDTAYDFSQGFCIPGADTAEFLRSSLEKLGLTPGNTTSSSSTGCPGWRATPITSSHFSRATIRITPG